MKGQNRQIHTDTKETRKLGERREKDQKHAYPPSVQLRVDVDHWPAALPESHSTMQAVSSFNSGLDSRWSPPHRPRRTSNFTFWAYLIKTVFLWFSQTDNYDATDRSARSHTVCALIFWSTPLKGKGWRTWLWIPSRRAARVGSELQKEMCTHWEHSTQLFGLL